MGLLSFDCFCVSDGNLIEEYNNMFCPIADHAERARQQFPNPTLEEVEAMRDETVERLKKKGVR